MGGWVGGWVGGETLSRTGDLGSDGDATEDFAEGRMRVEEGAFLWVWWVGGWVGGLSRLSGWVGGWVVGLSGLWLLFLSFVFFCLVDGWVDGWVAHYYPRVQG